MTGAATHARLGEGGGGLFTIERATANTDTAVTFVSVDAAHAAAIDAINVVVFVVDTAYTEPAAMAASEYAAGATPDSALTRSTMLSITETDGRKASPVADAASVNEEVGDVTVT